MTPDSLTKVIERWRNLSQRYWDDGNINKSYGITECADELIRFRDAWAAQIAQDIAENRQPISSPFTEGVLHACGVVRRDMLGVGTEPERGGM